MQPNAGHAPVSVHADTTMGRINGDILERFLKQDAEVKSLKALPLV